MCALQCDTGYWSNLNSSSTLINLVEPAPDQRCSSDNCKTFNYNHSPDDCITCWNETDMNVYSAWFARASYKEAGVSGRLQAEPFKLNTDHCQLQCGAGFWSNYGTSLIGTTKIH